MHLAKSGSSHPGKKKASIVLHDEKFSGTQISHEDAVVGGHGGPLNIFFLSVRGLEAEEECRRGHLSHRKISPRRERSRPIFPWNVTEWPGREHTAGELTGPLITWLLSLAPTLRNTNPVINGDKAKMAALISLQLILLRNPVESLPLIRVYKEPETFMHHMPLLSNLVTQALNVQRSEIALVTREQSPLMRFKFARTIAHYLSRCNASIIFIQSVFWANAWRDCPSFFWDNEKYSLTFWRGMP